LGILLSQESAEEEELDTTTKAVTRKPCSKHVIRHYKTHFHAAHYIKGHPKCGRLHGHTYKVEVEVFYPKTSPFVDFYELKTAVDRVLAIYDHSDIGDTTCEDIAEEIASQLELLFKRKVRVSVWETDSFGVTVYNE